MVAHPTAILLLALAACRGEPIQRDPLEWVPADAALVGQADVQALAKSALFGRTMRDGKPGGSMDLLGARCGYDPFESLEKVTFTMSREGLSRGEFGLVASGELDRDRILDCARKLAAGKRAAIKEWRWKGVRLIRSAVGSSGTIALADDGTVLVGDDGLLREMVRSGSGEPSIVGDGELMGALESLGRARSVRIAARLPPDSRDLLRVNLVEGLRLLAEADLLALGISVQRDVSVTAIARLGSEALAREAAQTIREQVSRAAQDPTIGFSPFSGPLRAFEIEARGRTVVAGVTLTERQLERIGDQLDDLLETSR